jgi:hypothetical protein
VIIEVGLLAVAAGILLGVGVAEVRRIEGKVALGCLLLVLGAAIAVMLA